MPAEAALAAKAGGAEGNRTPELCSAIAALSHLSYSPAPTAGRRKRWAPAYGKRLPSGLFPPLQRLSRKTFGPPFSPPFAANHRHGRKVLFADGLFAEYAVFTLRELRGSSFPPGRLVWARDDAPAGLECAGRLPGPSPYDYPEYHLNEAVTNLYVGLHREARGERLAATRLIQQHAVDRLLTYLELTTGGERQDAFAVERGAERRFGPEVLPLSRIVLGYDRNKEAALAVLDWLETRSEVNRMLAAEIRRLAS